MRAGCAYSIGFCAGGEVSGQVPHAAAASGGGGRRVGSGAEPVCPAGAGAHAGAFVSYSLTYFSGAPILRGNFLRGHLEVLQAGT
eukprot:1138718-Pelagomonas_calceolata.AAC.4